MSPDRLNSAAASQATSGTRHLCALYSQPAAAHDAQPVEMEDPMLILTLVLYLVFLIIILASAWSLMTSVERHAAQLYDDERAERRRFEGPDGRCAFHEQEPLPRYTSEVLPPYSADEQEPLLGDDRSDCPSYHTFSVVAVPEQEVPAEERE